MTNFFKELFEYNNHFNQKLITTLTEQPEKAPEKSLKLINHIINAQQIWNSRITTQNEFCVWEMHDLYDLHSLDHQNYQNTLEILNTIALDNVINYTNSKGIAFQNSVRDALFHVINHSTYHRGQIATDCKQNGIDPLITDYIFYKR